MHRKTTDIATKLRALLPALLLCMACNHALAQTDTLAPETAVMTTLNTRPLPDTTWQRLSNDPVFDAYRHQRETDKAPAKNRKEKAGQRTKSSEDSLLLKIIAGIVRFLTSALGKALLWIFLAAVIIFVLYKLVTGSNRFSFRSERRFGQPQEETEEDLDSTDWEHRLQEALRAGDNRMAVRYSYMRLLQLLQSKDLIRYRIDKTNHDYYYELMDTPYHKLFRQLSREYEYAWYGNYPMTAEATEAYLQQFRNLKTHLNAS